MTAAIFIYFPNKKNNTLKEQHFVHLYERDRGMKIFALLN